jgi:hypothetical protein
VSSANITGFGKQFTVRGRSFMYIMKSKDHRFYPRGNPCFTVPWLKKKF